MKKNVAGPYDEVLDFEELNQKYTPAIGKKSDKLINLKGYFGTNEQPHGGSNAVFNNSDAVVRNLDANQTNVDGFSEYYSNKIRSRQNNSRSSAAPQSGFIKHSSLPISQPLTFTATRELDFQNLNRFGDVENAERIREMNLHRL